MSKTKRTRAPAKKDANGAKAFPAAPAAARSPDAVALRAYELWRESGGSHGDDQAHWFRAEQELLAGAAAR